MPLSWNRIGWLSTTPTQRAFARFPQIQDTSDNGGDLAGGGVQEAPRSFSVRGSSRDKPGANH
jgi:hypothetical protein